MDYIFDDIVLYRSDDGTLHYLEVDSEDTVTLPPVLNRILLLLVSNQGQLITKEVFFTKVWDDYGKTSSSHTLNQYLSTLRKILAKYLSKKAIITVPRQGYMFALDITISQVEQTTEHLAPMQNDSQLEVSTSTPNIERKYIPVVSQTNTKKYIIFYLFLFIATISLTIITSKSNSSSTIVHPFTLGKIGSFSVYSFSEYKDEQHKKAAMEIVNQQANQENLYCDDNIYYYYYRNENINYGEKGDYSMLAWCKQVGSSSDQCITTRISW